MHNKIKHCVMMYESISVHRSLPKWQIAKAVKIRRLKEMSDCYKLTIDSVLRLEM